MSADADFRVVYFPVDGSSVLDAYDAAQSMQGMARSLAIVTHYALHSRVIKQAPSLSGARILATPPERGSFQLPFGIEIDSGTATALAGVGLGVVTNYITDLTKFLFRKISGLPEQVETSKLKELLEAVPGDIDAISDAVDEDVVRVHRPLLHNVNHFHIYGGTTQIGNFNQSTYDHAKARELGGGDEFVGTIASLNANSDNGRIYLQSEGRTVGFKRDRALQRLPIGDRRLLSWSLDQYTNGKDGTIKLIGKALRNREKRITSIFVVRVETIA